MSAGPNGPDTPVGDVPSAQVDELACLAGQLRHAVDGRAVIDQAKGMLMLRFGMDADAASRLLTRWSSESNTKVHVLAERLADSAADGEDAVARLILEMPDLPLAVHHAAWSGGE